MSGFKLLAIVPLNGCNEKFLKNLKIGTPYKFLNGVEIGLDKNHSRIEKVKMKKVSTLANLYTLDNGINIEISAVVGLNGSGKSALIELLYYTIYALSAYNSESCLIDLHSWKLQKKIDELNTSSEKISEKSQSSMSLLRAIRDNELKLNKKDFEGYTNAKSLLQNKLRQRSKLYHGQKKDDETNERLIKEELSVGLVYEVDEKVYCIIYSKEKVKLFGYTKNGRLKLEPLPFYFDPFFYSISLNYSHHSLNSSVIGNWINSLFHKNDGYATPVVINPMREDGNFNINRELHLSNERVMSNLTYDVANKKEVQFLNKYKLKKILFYVKKDFQLIKMNGFNDPHSEVKSNITKYLERDTFNKLISVQLVRSLLGDDILTKYTNYQDYALGYLEKKIEKIKEYYNHLFHDKNGNFSHPIFMRYLKKNKSHITKKLRQTINFIEKTSNDRSIWNQSKDYGYNELDIVQFKHWLSENDTDYSELSPSALMNFALPGFFNVDFQFETESGKSIKLSELSSGEQQMIFNINTITYHLYNLQSVHSENKEESSTKDKQNKKDVVTDGEVVSRLSYKNVSVILDEVEIYYHPEMQRELTTSLLRSLENIKNKDEIGIESIHILYLTHSPFILSDIPSSNIMRLKDGFPQPLMEQTFGANIHDLLANDFFLENGFMGEFAREKIENIIKGLTILINQKEIAQISSKYGSTIIPDYLVTKKEYLEKEIVYLQTENKAILLRDDIEKIIPLIGEPILKSKIMQLKNLAFES